MTSPYIVPFKAEHMLTFVDRDTYRTIEMKHAIEREMKGPAFTAMIDDRIIGCAGIVVMWQGAGYAWVVFSQGAAKHGIWITRMVRAFMNDIIHSLKLHRVEAVVLADSPRNIKWIRYLGFKPENSIAQAYTQDGRDVVRFELITENHNETYS